MTKINDNWLKIFDKYDVLSTINNGEFFSITSTQINEFMESRLMTKFDHTSNLPNLFKKHDLSILPVTRGSYVIGKFDAYQNVRYNTSANENICSFPVHLETINYNNIYSESSALNCAFISGILNHVAGEEVLPTVSGRMSTQKFDFSIQGKTPITSDYNIGVVNSQCEIDGGYEGQSKFLLIEAKNFSVDDFLVRQLYYPYRLWAGKIKKEVVPIFMTYSNNVFSFFIYNFTDV